MPAGVATLMRRAAACMLAGCASACRAALLSLVATGVASVPVLADWPADPYLGSLSSGTDLSSYSLGNFTAPSDGLLVVGAGGRFASGTGAINALTIGGTAALVTGSSGVTNPTAVAYKEVTAGAHAIVVGFSGTQQRCVAFAWFLPAGTYDLDTTPVAGAVSPGSTGTSTGNLTIAYPAEAIGFYVLSKNNTDAVTWSVAGEDAGVTPETSTRVFGANYEYGGAGGSVIENPSWSSATGRSITGITFAPSTLPPGALFRALLMDSTK